MQSVHDFTVRVSLQAAISPCSTAKSLSYEWREASGTIASTSTDPRFFKIAPYTLTAGTTYNLTITVTDSLGNANSGAVQVVVMKAPLVSAITGGDRSVGLGALTLEGSFSQDPDVAPGDPQGLAYSWACVRGGSSFGQPCGFAIPSAVKPQVNLPVPGEYIFRLAVSKDSRFVAASVTCTALITAPPAVVISPLTVRKVGYLPTCSIDVGLNRHQEEYPLRFDDRVRLNFRPVLHSHPLLATRGVQNAAHAVERCVGGQ
jgi:hypothetical protein